MKKYNLYTTVDGNPFNGRLFRSFSTIKRRSDWLFVRSLWLKNCGYSVCLTLDPSKRWYVSLSAVNDLGVQKFYYNLDDFDDMIIQSLF